MTCTDTDSLLYMSVVFLAFVISNLASWNPILILIISRSLFVHNNLLMVSALGALMTINNGGGVRATSTFNTVKAVGMLLTGPFIDPKASYMSPNDFECRRY